MGTMIYGHLQHPDAHRPIVTDGVSPQVLKAVVKVNLSLLTGDK